MGHRRSGYGRLKESTEDEEQGHKKEEVEVVVVNSTEPTVTVP